MKITAKRVLFFLLFISMIGMLMYQNWQSKPDSEKWLYLFGSGARDYAGKVLGPGRGTDVPVPAELSESAVIVYDSYVTFSSKQGTVLTLAFSPAGAPPGEGPGGRPWSAVGDGWYLLK
jgi:hypothetical protein